jgi:hypothetical protein
MRAQLERAGPLSDWRPFTDSWNRLGLDEFMADQGRYRRRRHAVFSAVPGEGFVRAPHQPHYQSLDYNPLNGGIERWFEPIEGVVASGPSLRTVLAQARAQFEALAGAQRWRVEVHQFRIEARADAPGQPTPEGMHRDGVDYVLVLLIDRSNIESGTTTIHAADGTLLGSFTLTQPFDAALVDDARVFHGVTAVMPVDATQPAHRDVLVATFRDASREQRGGA